MPNINRADPDAIFRLLFPDFSAEQIARCRQLSAGFREVLYGKRPRRRRRPSFARLAAKAKQLGLAVTIEPNGAVTLRADNSAPSNAAADSNPWLTDLDEMTKQ